MYIDIEVVPVSSPDDTPLDAARGRRIVAVVGKTEGNGGVNDFTRALAARAWTDALQSTPLTVMSGGTEGVLSPHVTLLLESDVQSGSGSLSAGFATTARLPTVALGRRAQAEAVAAATAEAIANGGFEQSDTRLVLVKCPLLTTEQIVASGGTAATEDSYESMALSRAASALGVALACGEIDSNELDEALAGDLSHWSSVASASSGTELDRCHVLVLGSPRESGGGLHAETVVMQDAIDMAPVLKLRDEILAKGGRVVQVFAKAEASSDGRVRGMRHTMLTDTDLSSTRHARAAVGGLLGGIFGTTALYVSGGAEHQGPPGGGPVTVVWDSSPEMNRGAL